MEDLTILGMDYSETLRSLAKKCFSSSTDENDEPIYTYNEEYMRFFVRQSFNGGKCGSFTQYFKSIILDDVFNFFSRIRH